MATAPFIADTAAVNWVDAGGGIHIRVYQSDGYTITERVWDGNGWSTGGFSAAGNQVSATAWYIGGQHSVRVYCSSDGVTTEWCWDAASADWYKGAYTGE